MARIDQKAFYTQNYETYGVSAEGAAWDSTQTQQRRFAAILSCLGEIGQDRLVDAGCGFGDFYFYLKSKNRLPKEYVGLDLCTHMVREAKARTGCRIMQKDILSQSIPRADWYIASGSMNLLTRMETQIFIQRCFTQSSKGFVFNLLEGRDQEGEFSYWNPHEVIALCKPFGGTISIKEGYLEGDFTVSLLHT